VTYKTGYKLRTETHEALAEAIRILVENMGPRQRREIARELQTTAGDYEGKASSLLLRLSLYVEPGR